MTGAGTRTLAQPDAFEPDGSGTRLAALEERQMVASGRKGVLQSELLPAAMLQRQDPCLIIHLHIKKTLPAQAVETQHKRVSVKINADAAGLPGHDRPRRIGKIKTPLVKKPGVGSRNALQRRIRFSSHAQEIPGVVV